MSHVLGIVYRAIETYLFHQAGMTRTAARTGAATLIQRFGSALNANIHFHMLFLDGVYVGEEGLVFRRVRPPTRGILEHLVQTIGQRVGAYLDRQGLLVRDIENTYLALESAEASAMDDLLGHSISYRIAVGRHAGRKAFTLQTIPAREDGKEDGKLAKASGFSILWSVSCTSLSPLLTP